MALSKLFQRIFFHNNTTPALNEDNLNAMSKGLSDVDDRLIELAGTIMEDVPEIREDLEILRPAIESIEENVEAAAESAEASEASALKSEGYAIGEQDGVEVGPDSEYYQNNAKYYADIANPPIENTVDFTDIITISDAINKAAKDVKLKVEAVQDLHGYDNPWVGGAGKNKLPITLAKLKANNTDGTWNGNVYSRNNAVFTVKTDNDGNVDSIIVTTSGGAVSSDTVFLLTKPTDWTVLSAGTYILSGCPSGGSLNTYQIHAQLYDDATSKDIRDFGSGGSNTYNTNVSLPSTRYIYIQIKSGVTLSSGITFKPMLRLSTDSATFEPYENICPISGWDNAKVTREGRNKQKNGVTNYSDSGVVITHNGDDSLTIQVTNASIGKNISNLWTGALGFAEVQIPTEKYYPNGTYIISAAEYGNSCYYQVARLAIGADWTTMELIGDTGNGTDATFTVEDGYYYWIRIRSGVNGTYTMKPMLRLATETDATYEPYKGVETTISLNGTRYGGTLDVTSGVLTLTHGIVDLDTFTFSVYNLENRIYYSPVLDTNKTEAIFEQYSIQTPPPSVSTWKDGCAIIESSNHRIYIKDTRYADATAFNAATKGKIVYELATPQTIQLTAEEIDLLYGYNTLFGDCGDISLTYDASGIIHIEEAKLDTETLKTIAAASSDFADFKARIAAL